MQRFYDKINKTGDCWEWMGARLPRGYGQFRFDGKTCLAHRVSYEIHIGEYPRGWSVATLAIIVTV